MFPENYKNFSKEKESIIREKILEFIGENEENLIDYFLYFSKDLRKRFYGLPIYDLKFLQDFFINKHRSSKSKKFFKHLNDLKNILDDPQTSEFYNFIQKEFPKNGLGILLEVINEEIENNDEQKYIDSLRKMEKSVQGLIKRGKSYNLYSIIEDYSLFGRKILWALFMKYKEIYEDKILKGRGYLPDEVVERLDDYFKSIKKLKNYKEEVKKLIGNDMIDPTRIFASNVSLFGIFLSFFGRINESNYPCLSKKDDIKGYLTQHIKEKEINKNTFISELAECLKTVLFNKYLEKFLTVRTSFYDDFFHGVDNIIVDLEEGDKVLGIDVTINLEKKIKKLVEKNKKTQVFRPEEGIQRKKEDINETLSRPDWRLLRFDFNLNFDSNLKKYKCVIIDEVKINNSFPVVIIPISLEDILEILEELKSRKFDYKKYSDVEKSITKKIINYVVLQLEIKLKNENLPNSQKLKSIIEKFENSLKFL